MLTHIPLRDNSLSRINEYSLLIRQKDIRRLKLLIKMKEVIFIDLILLLLLVKSIIVIYLSNYLSGN